MNIILIIRRNNEYYLEEKIMSSHLKKIYGWNLYFKLPYIEFRKRLSEISSLTYFQNKFDKIYMWLEEDVYKEINKKGNIIVAIDEDDWISSSLASTLRSYDFGYKPVVKWDVINIRPIGKSYIETRNLCRSCSYATRTPYSYKYIKTNVYMSGMWSDRSKLDQILSVKVDNLSSRSFLDENKFSHIIGLVKKRHFVEKVALLKDYETQVDLYNNLLEELYDSCKV